MVALRWWSWLLTDSLWCPGPCAAAPHRKVDQAIQAFKPYLFEIADMGESRSLNDSKLLKLIGENSLLYTDVVTKLGLLDTSDTAWRNDK